MKQILEKIKNKRMVNKEPNSFVVKENIEEKNSSDNSSE